MHTPANGGFSLIELMIVITIISVLSAIAIPSYQFYIKRARFAEIVNTSDMFKTAVTLAMQAGNSLSELTTNAYGIPPAPQATKNLQSLTVENGVITAIGTALLDNTSSILTPSTDGYTWTQSGTCLQLGLCSQG